MPISASEPLVWRHFTRPALEAQYSLSLHPDRARAYARFAQASAAFRDAQAWSEIAYGKHPRERFELFPGRPGGGLFVFIHGGYWRALAKETFSFVAAPFVARGVTVANLEYPLAPEVGMSGIVAAALRGVHAALSAGIVCGADLRRVVVSGHSAGGHLTAAALDPGRYVAGMEGFSLAGVVPISGLFDLAPLAQVALNDTLGMDALEAERLSPIHAARAGLAPVIAAVGADETPEFQRQSADFVAALREAGSEARALKVPGKNHFTVLDALADPASELTQAAFSLLGLR